MNPDLWGWYHLGGHNFLSVWKLCCLPLSFLVWCHHSLREASLTSQPLLESYSSFPKFTLQELQTQSPVRPEGRPIIMTAITANIFQLFVSRHYSSCFTCVISVNFPNNPRRHVIPIFKWGGGAKEGSGSCKSIGWLSFRANQPLPEVSLF